VLAYVEQSSKSPDYNKHNSWPPHPSNAALESLKKMQIETFKVTLASFSFLFHASGDIDVNQTRDLLSGSTSRCACIQLADCAGRERAEEDCYAIERMLDGSDVEPADLKAHTKSLASEAQGLVLRFYFGVAEVY
jgi:hypothetical protein